MADGGSAFFSSRRSFLSTKPAIPGSAPAQAMPRGPYYDIILNESTLYRNEKPQDPPAPPSSAVVEEQPQQPAAADNNSSKPKSRGRKTKEDKQQPTSGRKPKPTAAAAAAAAVAVVPPVPPIEPSPPVPTPPPSRAQEQARVIFGSRLAGPAERAERLADMQSRSTLVAGVLVPPRPDEPDNCCMSGCVNCVWERYRDELEQWAAAHTEAEQRLRAARPGALSPRRTGHSTGHSTGGRQHGRRRRRLRDQLGQFRHGQGEQQDQDGQDFWDDDLYQNVPVGIREFMKQEKRLKLKHEREGTDGG